MKDFYIYNLVNFNRCLFSYVKDVIVKFIILCVFLFVMILLLVFELLNERIY